MSVLETPRLIFRGRVTWDPIVTNNSPAQYDENDAETVFSPGADVAAFRQAAIAAMRSRYPALRSRRSKISGTRKSRTT